MPGNWIGSAAAVSGEAADCGGSKPCEDRISGANDVARAPDRTNQLGVRLVAGDLPAADGVAPEKIRLAEEDVVDDDAGAGAGEEAEDAAVHEARPWPPADTRLQRPHGRLVDFDDGDVRTSPRRIGRG